MNVITSSSSSFVNIDWRLSIFSSLDLDHTADVQYVASPTLVKWFAHVYFYRLHAWGDTLEEAFEHCVESMFGYMTELDTVDETESHEVEAKGEDMLSLLFHLLDEFLYLFCAEPFFVAKVITWWPFNFVKLKTCLITEGQDHRVWPGELQHQSNWLWWAFQFGQTPSRNWSKGHHLFQHASPWIRRYQTCLCDHWHLSLQLSIPLFKIYWWCVFYQSHKCNCLKHYTISVDDDRFSRKLWNVQNTRLFDWSRKISSTFDKKCREFTTSSSIFVAQCEKKRQQMGNPSRKRHFSDVSHAWSAVRSLIKNPTAIHTHGSSEKGPTKANNSLIFEAVGTVEPPRICKYPRNLNTSTWKKGCCSVSEVHISYNYQKRPGGGRKVLAISDV